MGKEPCVSRELEEKKRRRRKGEAKKKEKEKKKWREGKKRKRRKRKGDAGRIRGDGRESGVASTRSDMHEKREDRVNFKR
jgi:hypothetical protein